MIEKNLIKLAQKVADAIQLALEDAITYDTNVAEAGYQVVEAAEGVIPSEYHIKFSAKEKTLRVIKVDSNKEELTLKFFFVIKETDDGRDCLVLKDKIYVVVDGKVNVLFIDKAGIVSGK